MKAIKHAVLVVLSAVVLFGFTGCVSLSPELVQALARDNASFCASADLRGGVGSLLNPAGGYGQSTLRLCRSNKENATITMTQDGSISIQNGQN